VIVTQTEFLRRAQHPGGFNAAYLGFADGVPIAHLGAWRGIYAAQFGAGIRRTADNLGLAAAGIDPAHGEMFGIGMSLHVDDACYYDVRRHGIYRFGPFDLEPGHCEQITKPVQIRSQRREFPQPIECYFHNLLSNGDAKV
jgi:hypothetical protein